MSLFQHYLANPHFLLRAVRVWSSLSKDNVDLEVNLDRLIALLLCAISPISFADQAGTAHFSQLFVDMHPIRSGWCEVGGRVTGGLVELRSKSGKRAFEIFPESGRFVLVEIKKENSIERFYFTGERAVTQLGKIFFDATEFKDATAWERLMGSELMLAMIYLPNMENPPPGCKWSLKKK